MLLDLAKGTCAIKCPPKENVVKTPKKVLLEDGFKVNKIHFILHYVYINLIFNNNVF